MRPVVEATRLLKFPSLASSSSSSSSSPSPSSSSDDRKIGTATIMSKSRRGGYNSILFNDRSLPEPTDGNHHDDDRGGTDSPDDDDVVVSRDSNRRAPLSHHSGRNVTARSNDDEGDDEGDGYVVVVVAGCPVSAAAADEHNVASPRHHRPPALTVDIEDAIDRLGMGPFQRLIVLACGLCFAADAMEILLLSFLAVILQGEWDLREGQSDALISVVFAGAMAGTLVLSALADRLGRRPVFALTAALISIFGVATGLCTTYGQVLLARFLVGVGVGGLTVPYDALGEFLPTSSRGRNVLSTSFFWTAGSLLVPLFAWLTLDGSGGDGGDGGGGRGSWRGFVVLCALPCVVSTVLGICVVPESPRWLLTRGRTDQALRILRRAAARNGKDPLLTFPAGTRLVDRTATAVAAKSNVSPIRSAGTAESNRYRQRGDEPLAAADDDDGDDDDDRPIPTNGCRLVCFNAELRKMGVMLSGQWFGLAFMYYGAIIAVSIVFSSTDAGGGDGSTARSSDGGYDFDYSAIVISASAEIIGLLMAIFTVDRLGRVRTQAWCYFLGGLCILILGLLDFYLGGGMADKEPMAEQHEVGGAAAAAAVEMQDGQQILERRRLILFAFLARLFIMAATSVTWLHTSELLPTEIRATGHGLANACARLGGLCTPYIITKSTSLRTIGIVMFLVGVGTSLCCSGLPETAGMALGDFDRGSRRQGQIQMQDMDTSDRRRTSKGGQAAGHDDEDGEKTQNTDEDEKDVDSFAIV